MGRPRTPLDRWRLSSVNSCRAGGSLLACCLGIRYVFPNVRYPHRVWPMNDSTLRGDCRALYIPPERMTLHGFRAVARTVLDEMLGSRPDFIEHRLAHVVRDPNASLGRLLGPAQSRRRAPRLDGGPREPCQRRGNLTPDLAYGYSRA